jgi:hypothetical protein
MASARALIDTLPGFRRRFVVTPSEGSVRTELEDDYHCMRVTVAHQGGIATTVDGFMLRAPWTTCPGAEARLRETFAGVALADFAARGEKTTNCTHLHDLATLAAAHVGDSAPTVYDVLVSDPGPDKLVRAELRRDGETIFDWTLKGFTIVAPETVAGIDFGTFKTLLATLDPIGQEAAKILRWGIMVGSGRSIPIEHQSDASKLPPGCYTFQPDTAARAKRVGVIRDFSTGRAFPLDGREHARESVRSNAN